MYDLIMSHEKAAAIVLASGHEGWLKYLQSVFPDANLFQCSEEWIRNKKLVCKAKGQHRDVVIGWADVHK